MIGHATAQLLERAATHALRGFLFACGRGAPAYAGALFEQRYIAHCHSIEFELTFVGHAPLRWRICKNELRGALSGDIEYAYNSGLPSLYSLLYEDHLIELDLRRAREVVHEAVRLADPATINSAQRWYAEYHDSVMRRHRGVSISQVHDPNDFTPLSPLVEAGGPRTITAGRIRSLRDMARDLPQPSHVQIDAARVMEEMLRFVGLDTNVLVGSEVGGKDASARGLALLKEWLSPAQLASYEKHKHFEVIGSHTGARYRIRHGRQQNIEEIDADGNKVAGLCFLPEGQLVAGDCMLAQKIALETDEEGALKIANRWEVGGWSMSPMEGGYMYSDELSDVLRQQEVQPLSRFVMMAPVT